MKKRWLIFSTIQTYSGETGESAFVAVSKLDKSPNLQAITNLSSVPALSEIIFPPEREDCSPKLDSEGSRIFKPSKVIQTQTKTDHLASMRGLSSKSNLGTTNTLKNFLSIFYFAPSLIYCTIELSKEIKHVYVI